jgi:DNA-3-methyladenine glycosylase
LSTIITRKKLVVKSELTFGMPPKNSSRLRSPRGQDETTAVNTLFDGPTVAVARRLVGAILARRVPKGLPGAGTWLRGRIVETEAYLPIVDPSCHGYRGPTPRSVTLFGRPGHAYVYLIYGMYYCFNVTTEPPGIGAAVLVRAVEPLAGTEVMRRLRGCDVPTAAVASGPGNVCRAFAIDLRCDGADLRTGDLRIEPGVDPAPTALAVTPRIGLSTARTWPLRFFDPASPSVSPFRRRGPNGLSLKSIRERPITRGEG